MTIEIIVYVWKIGSTANLFGAYHMAEVAMRYSDFVLRAYNLAKSLGFTPGKIMPPRAFCLDESQGYPVILIAKHFGVFPFNHGRVGELFWLTVMGRMRVMVKIWLLFSKVFLVSRQLNRVAG